MPACDAFRRHSNLRARLGARDGLSSSRDPPYRAIAGHGGAAAAFNSDRAQRRNGQSVADLKGKRVSVSTSACAHHWLVSEDLAPARAWGPEGSCHLRWAPPSRKIAALKRREIGTAWSPTCRRLAAGAQRRRAHPDAAFGQLVKDFLYPRDLRHQQGDREKPERGGFPSRAGSTTIAFMRGNKPETVDIAKDVMARMADDPAPHL